MKIRSLTARVAVLVGVTIVVVLGVAATLMDNMVDSQAERRFNNGLVTQARVLESLVNIGPAGVKLEKAEQPHMDLRYDLAPATWAVACTDGSRIASEPPPVRYPRHWQTVESTHPALVDLQVSGQPVRAVMFRFNAGNGMSMPTPLHHSCRLVFMRSIARLDDVLHTIDIILLVVPALALLLVLGLIPLLVRRGLRPLSALGESMQTIGPQAAGQRLAVTGTRELDPLVARFNEVLARMDEGIARERDFAGALAHETRTRLAELRALVEVEQHYPGGRPLDALLREVADIRSDLEATVSSLLLLTRLDADIQELQWADVDVGRALHRSVDRLASKSTQRDVDWEWHINAAVVHARVDRALLDVILDNLLGNACAYACAGSKVSIELAPGHLTVDNATTDLTREEVNKFGRRFWGKHHGDEAHAGLGLAMAGAAARAMDKTMAFRLDDRQRLQARLGWHRGDVDCGLSGQVATT